MKIKKAKKNQENTIEPINIPVPKEIEETRIIPIGWLSKILFKFVRFKVVKKMIPNPILQTLQEEISLFSLIPKESWKQSGWDIQRRSK